MVPGSTCYEYFVQKLMGMTAEECVILAIALDFHMGKDKPPLAGDVTEIATMEQESGAMTYVRILVVLDKQSGQQKKANEQVRKARLS